jgi:hypothetical protein
VPALLGLEVYRLSNSLGYIGRFNPEEGKSMFLRKVRNHLQDYMVSKFPAYFNPEVRGSTAWCQTTEVHDLNSHCLENLKTYKVVIS